jgi:hypothetical protein
MFRMAHLIYSALSSLDGAIYRALLELATPFYSWENEDAYKTSHKFPNSGRVRVTVEYVRSYLDLNSRFWIKISDQDL